MAAAGIAQETHVSSLFITQGIDMNFVAELNN